MFKVISSSILKSSLTILDLVKLNISLSIRFRLNRDLLFEKFDFKRFNFLRNFLLGNLRINSSNSSNDLAILSLAIVP